MSHTPGPWKQSIDNGRVIEAGRTKVAVASPTSPPPIAWANAKLIAAAPEMLECLQRLIDVHDLGYTPGEGLIQQLRQVAQKAIGVEQ